MKSHQITIGGETFAIKTDGDEEHVRELARMVQERYDELNNHKGPRSSQGFRTMAMLAMAMLDELMELQGKYDSMSRETVDFAENAVQGTHYSHHSPYPLSPQHLWRAYASYGGLIV